MGKDKEDSNDPMEVDARLPILADRVVSFYRCKSTDVTRMLKNDDYLNAMLEFLDDTDQPRLFVWVAADGMQASRNPPPASKRKIMYLLKKNRVQLTHDNAKTELVCGDVSPDVLTSLDAVSKNVFLPMLRNPKNHSGLPDIVSKEVMDNFYKFITNTHVTIGQNEGETRLALPPGSVELEDEEKQMKDKDFVHLLESSIVSWTNQIKKVLRLDPEMVLKGDTHPGPLAEIQFWKSKADNLNSIDQQLRSDNIVRIMSILDATKSTYYPAFKRVITEVEHAREEANDNVRFLAPLKQHFDGLDPSAGAIDFEELPLTFRRIMHLLFMVWKRSGYYNTPTRFVVIIREICNNVIDQSREFINIDDLFGIECQEAVDRLTNAIRVCGKFKSIYFEYKTRSAEELPDNPWRLQNSALFHRLDSFLERCHDLLDLFQTAFQFNKLEKIEIGGTKGKTLSTSLRQIHLEFGQAFDKFKELPYDVLDVNQKQFDDAFYEFRCLMKELERRLSSILNQGFEDCGTVNAAIKLVESFEGLMDRELIQTNLEKRQVDLLHSYGEDLREVQNTFLQLKNSPPSYRNMPPTSGALRWVRGLLERINTPMQKINRMSRHLLESEEAQAVVKNYENVVGLLLDFEKATYGSWEHEVENVSQAKLKQTLLVRDEETKHLDVNFDPALVRLLREVAYVRKLNALEEGSEERQLQIPEEASNIFKKAETYRTQTGKLELIVRMYNQILSSILEVERPLLSTQLDEIDKILEKGLKHLTWKGHGIDQFISSVMTAVKDASTILSTMKSNVSEIENLLKGWSQALLIERVEGRSVGIATFNKHYDQLRTTRQKEVTDGGVFIHKKLQDTFKLLKGLSKGSPHWKSYVEYVNNIVIDGVRSTIRHSFTYLSEQMDPEIIAKHEQPPMLEIKLELIAEVAISDEERAHLSAEDSIQCSPTLRERSSDQQSLESIVSSWITDIYYVSELVKRLDNPDGTYRGLVEEDAELTALKERILGFVQSNADNCQSYISQFLNFSDLWTRDIKDEFKDFCSKYKPTDAHGDDEEHNVEQKSKHDDVDSDPSLDEFEQMIVHYENIQENISNLPNNENVNWVRVDSRPIKHALSSTCGKWKSVYTDYLTSKVQGKLKDLQSFMDEVDKGLEAEINESSSIEELEVIMGHIRDVRVRVDSVDTSWKPLGHIAALLKKHDADLNEQYMRKLEQLPLAWNNLKKKTFQKRELLSPLQDQQASKLKQEIGTFTRSMKEFREAFLRDAPFKFSTGIDEAYKLLDEQHKKLSRVEKDVSVFVNKQELFELQVADYPDLKRCRVELGYLKTLWDLVSMVMNQFDDWMITPLRQVDTDMMVEETKKLAKETKRFASKFRSWDAYKGLEDELKNMLTSLPLVQDLRSPAMRDRHWKTLMREIRRPGAQSFNPDDDSFSLKQLLNLGLHDHVEAVADVVDKANKELVIETNLTKIEKAWAVMALSYAEDADTNVYMLNKVDDIIEVLEEHQVLLQAMSGSRNVEYFQTDVDRWQRSLGQVDSVLNIWIEVQRSWQNLFPIFVLSEDIRQQLPEDAIRFHGVDKIWRDLMSNAHDITNVLEACTSDVIRKRMNEKHDILDVLENMSSDLEQCEKSLADYLETKRKAFPRFYFVSAADLVDILSKGSEPTSIMKHIGKVMDSLETVEFENDSNGELRDAVKMVSREGEEVPFTKTYNCNGAVEAWLTGLVSNIRTTIKDTLYEAYANYHEQSRENWIFQYPAQIVVVASRIVGTSEMNAAFERLEDGQESALKEYHKQQIDSLALLTKIVQGELTANDRRKLIHLVTVEVHARDVTQQLIDIRADNMQCFQWQSQLRYAWDDDKGCVINIADAEFLYSYEYNGNCGCLVITPLTDRCYITLTQSLRLIMGGAPAGPAGTGKTETTKDLGRNLALPVYVFNCSDQMDYKSLGNIFKGLAMVGCWGCFDEFNRIPTEVLSVVATQFKSILDAIRSKKERFNFQGEDIPIIPTCGAFITMNPGYKGRQELPENVKALFRPCAMVVPDLELIIEIMLNAEGFIKAKPLAKKFVTLYRLNKELLSKQDHYDWGLRAIKSVLVIAGGLRRASPEIDEELVLMRALRDTNFAKLARDDIEIFMGLIRDLFPGMDLPPQRDPNLQAAVKKAATEMKLQMGENEIFVLKCIQLKELIDVRHSVFVLGPSGCGKTAVWQTLSRALSGMGQKTHAQIINPKAVTSNELYGFMHPVTREWKDGLLSFYMRDYAVQTKQTKNWAWVVLDGDIDAEWIESMNTVMDDNKVLTLASNERIPLTSTMRMFFEISHLKNATPATVSRAGILFLNESDIGWQPFVDSWLDKRDTDSERAILERLFQAYVVDILEYLHAHCKHVIPLMDFGMVTSLCHLLDGLVDAEAAKESKGEPKEYYEAVFLFAAVWAFGGGLNVDGSSDYQLSFSNWMRRTYKSVASLFPDEGRVFDYFYDHERGEMVLWQEKVPAYVPQPDMPFQSITVPTADTVRMNFVMNCLADNPREPHPVMLVGTAGTGKTSVVKDKLSQLPEEKMFTAINFNSQTDAASLQAILEQPLEKKAGRQFGPPGRKQLIYFIDDLNMPTPDKYGTQSAIAFLRTHIDYGFWYDRARLTQKEVKGVQYIAAMNPKSGSFTIDDRLQRWFTVLACTFPSESALTLIYESIFNHHLSTFESRVKTLSSKIVNATIDLHQQVSKTFLPTAAKFHYQFNLRELSSVFEGLCMSLPDYYQQSLPMVRLWVHECNRVFGDRLVTDDDLTRFGELVTDVSKKYFEDLNQDNVHEEPLIYTSFSKRTAEDTPVYYGISEFSKLRQTLDTFLAEYNDSHAVMNLELFEQAMSHVCRITRILDRPRGNALLVGVGGSGKQSLTRLAAHINGFETFQISVTSSYGMTEFRNDVQELYKKTGLKGLGYVFLITDQQIVDNRMLVYLNDLLSSGYIPELFTPDERDQIIGSIGNEVKQQGLDYNNRTVCWDYFIDKVRRNLHVVVCFSPIGEDFRRRCRQFPALTNCTSIDWFHAWPNEALVSVASRFLADVKMESNDIRENVGHHMAFVHESVTAECANYLNEERRFYYTTPKSFLELIALFKSLLQDKRDDVAQLVKRLETGLVKLKESSDKVADLKVVLQEEEVVVKQKQEATELLLEQVGKDRNVVEEQTAVAQKEEEKTNEIVAEVEALEAGCRKDLEEAEPIVEAALKSLDSLDKSSLTELKSFTKPAEDVQRVAEAVIILTADPKRKGKLDTSWGAAKKMMAQVDAFLKDLKNFDKENIPEQNLDRLQPYLDNENFSPEIIQTKSKAAAGLCSWVVNIVRYYKIYREVEPKRIKAAEAKKKLEQAKSSLLKVQNTVKGLQARLDSLLQEFEQAREEKVRIEEQARKTQQKLDLANRLVVGLADEKVRWASSVEALQEREKFLVGDVLLASSFVSYAGGFSRPFREKLVRDLWMSDLEQREIPLTEEVDILYSVLTNEAEVAQWSNEGLPADRFSVENGAIVVACSRWPLLIDPQLQGIKWIRNHEVQNNLQVLRLTQKNCMTLLEQAIENGAPVLLENIAESIDPVLEPLLSKSIVKKGPNFFVRLGDKDVHYHKDFRLYLQTKMASPHYRPEICAQTTLLNFTVTEDGLEDQLLEEVVRKERPDLEQQRAQLIRDLNQFKIDLKKCEDDLLYELSNAEGDILENVTLIENLENTKKKSIQIQESVKQATETSKEISESRERYRPSATRGSLLYFQIDQLRAIDHMYQYSLESFMYMFHKALANAIAAEDVDERVSKITESVTETLFNYVSRGLFERHKLIFSSLLCFSILQRANEVDPTHLNFLLRGKKVVTEEVPEVCTEWLPEPAWQNVLGLAEVESSTGPPFSQLPSDIEGSHKRWREWMAHEKPEDERLPSDWKNLNNFEKLLIVKCLRPDRITVAVTKYVASALGEKYVSDPAVSLGVSFKDSGPLTPIFFILSPGVDPVAAVEELGKTLGFTTDNGKLENVSLGQGQEPVAEAALDRGFKEGTWVILNNIHLTAKWLPVLEKKIDQFETIMREQEKEEQMHAATQQQQLEAPASNEDDAAEDNAADPSDAGNDADGAESVDASVAGKDKDEVASLKSGASQMSLAIEKAETDSVADSTTMASQRAAFRDGGVSKAEIRRAKQAAKRSAYKEKSKVRGHPDFRLFLSADPSPLIPMSVLQRSIKLVNEPPAGLKANMLRGIRQFSDETWDASSKQSEFKSILFTLCLFHATVVERKKYGPQGWNRGYPFNLGDLTTCVAVLNNYMEDRPKIPFEDLRYVFGEIMYGGHITDDWDRRLCMAYLEKYVHEELLEGIEYFEGFSTPSTTLNHAGFVQTIEEELPTESPACFGLPANAEIGFRTSQGEYLFSTILELRPQELSGGQGLTLQESAKMVLDDILERLPDNFDLQDVAERLEGDRGPFQNVFYQEVERMNRLLSEMRRALMELDLGLKGDLSISEAMQALMVELAGDRVPESWEAYAYPSLHPLGSWVVNLLQRHSQLDAWTRDLQTPTVTNVSYLFSPISFLTAVMQATARKNQWPLDRMGMVVDVTKKMPEDIEAPARDGQFVYGMYLEGARWDAKTGALGEASLKELYTKMPVIQIRAVPLEKMPKNDVYTCPMYITQQRGPTYVSSIPVKSGDNPLKWTIAGAALIMDVVQA